MTDQWSRAAELLEFRTDNTRKAYTSTVAGFRRWLEDRAPTAQLAVAYLGVLRERGLKNSSLLRHKPALEWFVTDVLEEPAPRFPKFTREQHQPRWLTVEEVKQLTAVCSDKREMACIMVMIHCGLRVSETIDLKWANIDLKDGYLTVMGKGAKEGTIPIAEEALRALKTLRELPSRRPRKRGRGAVGDKVFPWSYDTLRRRLTALATAARIEDFAPHALRHTCATHALQRGVDLRYVAQLLRHQNIATTQIYTHVRPADLKENLKPSTYGDGAASA